MNEENDAFNAKTILITIKAEKKELNRFIAPESRNLKQWRAQK